MVVPRVSQVRDFGPGRPRGSSLKARARCLARGVCLFELPSYLVDRPSEVTRATSGRRAAVREDFPFPRGRLRPRASNDQFFFTGRVCEMSEASGGATAMDTLERKFAIPEKSGDAGEADSPEQSGVQTPKHEYQSGFKRLRPKGWEEVEGSEHGTGSGEDDELPGTSAGSIEATPDEVRYLQNRTKSACSQLADIIVELRRERCARRPRPTHARIFQKTSSKPRRAPRALFKIWIPRVTAPGSTLRLTRSPF